MSNWHIWKSRERYGWRGYATYTNQQNWRERFSTHLEVSWNQKFHNLGFSINFGDRVSESPFKLMLGLYWVAFYFSLNFPRLGEFCEWLGRGHRREVSLRFHNGAMWWMLWYDDNHGYDDHHRCDKWRKPIWPWSLGRKKYRSWMCLRNGNIDLNPLDAIWGSKRFEYKTLEEKDKTIKVDQFPNDRYPIHLKLQKVYCGRLHGPKWVRDYKFSHWSVDWSVDGGIPVQNHSWKGDGIWASSERIDSPSNWWVKAIIQLRKRVEADRIKCNYRPPSSLLDIPQKQNQDSVGYLEFKDYPDSDLENVELWANANKKEN